MTKPFRRLSVALLLLLATTAIAAPAQTAQELDAYWVEVSRTVASGDFEGYSALYHPDAVLVSGTTSVPIAQALSNWAAGFAETREGTSTPQVDFRFTERRHSETTAHETGIFRFTAQTPGAEPVVQYVHFEALMVKTTGWLMLMEYQKSAATEQEWEAAHSG